MKNTYTLEEINEASVIEISDVRFDKRIDNAILGALTAEMSGRFYCVAVKIGNNYFHNIIFSAEKPTGVLLSKDFIVDYETFNPKLQNFYHHDIEAADVKRACFLSGWCDSKAEQIDFAIRCNKK